MNGPGSDIKVLQIDAGDDHSVFLSVDGTVWTCGCPYDGRLGLTEEVMKKHQEEFVPEDASAKREEAGVLVPLEVQEDLQTRQVVAICAGASYTLCRTLAKETFWFGTLDCTFTASLCTPLSLLFILWTSPVDESIAKSSVPCQLKSFEAYPLTAMASRTYSNITIVRGDVSRFPSLDESLITSVLHFI